MRKTLTALLIGSGTAALALSLGATTAMAGNARATWSVKPGGSVSASGSIKVKDTKTGYSGLCTLLEFAATLKSGSGLSGARIGSLSSVIHGGCSAAGFTFTVTAQGLPYSLNATSFKAGVTTGTIKGVDLVITSSACNATLDGTGAGADNGVVKITYTNSTGIVRFLPTGGDIHVWAVSGCLGLVNNGDLMSFSASLKLTPQQIITSP